jgi:putative flippase GtrA
MKRTVLSFLSVGALSTGLQYLILVAAVEFLGWPPPAASSVGFCLSAMVNYWLNYHVTFNSRASHATAVSRFVLVAIIGLLINAGAMLVLDTALGLHYLLAQILATCLTVAWTFAASHYWTFRAPAAGGGT